METDILLLNAAKKMDEEALTRIFDLFAPQLYRYTLRLCEDPLKADQIVGDAFARFVEKLSAGEGPAANLRSHLYEITYQIILADVCRDRWRGPMEAYLPTHIGKSSTPGNRGDQELLEVALQVIKYDLTGDQCHVLFLRFLEGFTLKETAAIIGKKVGNVKVIQSRAIAALRKALEYQGFEISDPPLDMAAILTSYARDSQGEYRTGLLST